MAKGNLIAQASVTDPEAYGTCTRAADADFILIESTD